MRRNPFYPSLCLLVPAMLAPGLLSMAHSQSEEKAGSNQSVSYEILEDGMGNVIDIGVPPETNEKQLRATLVKAANEHQDDSARDYIGFYLTIDAYLVQGGRHSDIPAGRLKRYVPLKNPKERRSMHVDRGKGDKFTITLSSARAHLPK